MALRGQRGQARRSRPRSASAPARSRSGSAKRSPPAAWCLLARSVAGAVGAAAAVCRGPDRRLRARRHADGRSPDREPAKAGESGDSVAPVAQPLWSHRVRHPRDRSRPARSPRSRSGARRSRDLSPGMRRSIRCSGHCKQWCRQCRHIPCVCTMSFQLFI